MMIGGSYHRRSGFTVAEVLVSMFVLSLLMSFVYTAMLASTQEVKRARSDTTTQSTALIALEKIFTEAISSDARTVTITQTPTVSVSFLSLEPPSDPYAPPADPNWYDRFNLDTTPLIWKKFVIIYYDSVEKRLYRKEIPYSGGSQPARLKEDAIPTIISNLNYPRTASANHVYDFQIYMPKAPLLKYKVTTRRPGYRSTEETTLESSVTLRNTPCNI